MQTQCNTVQTQCNTVQTQCNTLHLTVQHSATVTQCKHKQTPMLLKIWMKFSRCRLLVEKKMLLHLLLFFSFDCAWITFKFIRQCKDVHLYGFNFRIWIFGTLPFQLVSENEGGSAPLRIWAKTKAWDLTWQPVPVQTFANLGFTQFWLHSKQFHLANVQLVNRKGLDSIDKYFILW